MSFWSGETLSTRLPSLIDPYDSAQIDCAAYTLRVGPEAYVSPANSKEAATRTRSTLKEREGILIPPGQFAFLLTEEHVRVPSNAIAFISMKAKIKFRGLVNVSGFHVDPGYQGRLIFSVFNAGPLTVHLARGDDCFLIWYADLDRDSEDIKEGGSFEGISSELINSISGEVQSLTGLSKRISRIERDHRILVTSATIAITLAGAILVRSCISAAPSQAAGTTSRPPPAAVTTTPQAAPAQPPPPTTTGADQPSTGRSDGRGRGNVGRENSGRR
jgi:dCTP deaminase